ncbi:hypothetical protein DXG01_006527, partial [Tephrocybe rancida]
MKDALDPDLTRLALWEVGFEVPREDMHGKEGKEQVSEMTACWALAGARAEGDCIHRFQAIAYAPRAIIACKMLPPVRAALAKPVEHGEGSSPDAEPVEPVSAKSTKLFMSALSRASEENTGGKNSGAYEGSVGEYRDDLCLAQFMEGLSALYCLPDPDAMLDPKEVVDIPRAQAEAGAEEAFRVVFEYGFKIKLNHHIVYHA